MEAKFCIKFISVTEIQIKKWLFSFQTNCSCSEERKECCYYFNNRSGKLPARIWSNNATPLVGNKRWQIDCGWNKQILSVRWAVCRSKAQDTICTDAGDRWNWNAIRAHSWKGWVGLSSCQKQQIGFWRITGNWNNSLQEKKLI